MATTEMNCLASGGGYTLNPSYVDRYRGYIGTKTVTIDTSKAYIISGVMEGTDNYFVYYLGVGETTGTALQTTLTPTNIIVSVSGTTMTITIDTSNTYITNINIAEL